MPITDFFSKIFAICYLSGIVRCQLFQPTSTNQIAPQRKLLGQDAEGLVKWEVLDHKTNYIRTWRVRVYEATAVTFSSSVCQKREKKQNICETIEAQGGQDWKPAIRCPLGSALLLAKQRDPLCTASNLTKPLRVVGMC